MTADQTAAELTTRDVLLQVDRRLTLIEEDLRSLDEKLDDKVDALRSEMNTQNTSLRSEMNTQNTNLRSEMNTQNTSLRNELYVQFGGLRSEMNDRFSRIDNKFWLQTALILSSWISLVVLLLFK